MLRLELEVELALNDRGEDGVTECGVPTCKRKTWFPGSITELYFCRSEGAVSSGWWPAVRP
jgi:hypothetical protein